MKKNLTSSTIELACNKISSVSLQPATDKAVELFNFNYKNLTCHSKTESADVELLRRVVGFNVQQKYE